MAPLLELKDVNTYYGAVHALRGVSLKVEEGEIVTLIGSNGAGKTTTLKMLAGLLHPTSGDASVLGYRPWERADGYRRQFSLLLGQKNQLWWDLPAIESFHLLRAIYGLPADQFKTTLDELVALLAVEKKLNVMVRELSLGERMKMELTAALLHSPDVLFLDEPTSGVDPPSRRRFWDLIYTLAADGVVVVHHDDTLDRTTNGTGPIAARTAAELSRVDAGEGETIPVLADLLHRYRETPIIIEMKVDSAAMGEAVARVVRQSGAAGRECLAGFGSRSVRAARALLPGTVTYLADEGDVFAHAFEQGFDGLKGFRLAADHDGQRGVFGAHFATRNWGI